MTGFASRNNLSGYLLATSAALSVLTFGAVEPLGFAPAQLTVFLLAIFTFWREGLPRLPITTRFILLALVTIPLLQLIPWPQRLISFVSSSRVQLTEALREAAVPVAASLTFSVYPYATATALLRLACYLLVLLLAVHQYQKLRRQPALVGLLIGLGLFEACYGIIQYLTGFQYIFFYKKSIFSLDATGTYINRNHYAGLLEMCLPFTAAAMLNHTRKFADGAHGLLRQVLLSPQSSRFLRDAVLLIVMLVGLLFSLSRAGIVAGLFGIGVAVAVSVQKHRRSVLVIMLPILLITTAYAIWIGLAPMVDRFADLMGSTSDPQMRLAIWRDTVEIVKDFPLLGTGLGTYQWVSLHYQSALLSYNYEHAHNDVLQFATELGIPIALILWISLWVLLIRLVRKAAHLRQSSDRVLAAGSAGALAAILLHSLADFNLQIPANAMIFSWIAGSALALIHRSRESNSPRNSPYGPITIDLAEE